MDMKYKNKNKIKEERTKRNKKSFNSKFINK